MALTSQLLISGQPMTRASQQAPPHVQHMQVCTGPGTAQVHTRNAGPCPSSKQPADLEEQCANDRGEAKCTGHTFRAPITAAMPARTGSIPPGR
jgi:hypothetical protein